MKVLGIDPSTKTGIVLLEGNRVVFSQGYNPLAKGFARPLLVGTAIDGLCVQHAPDIAVIEGYAFNIGGKIKQSPSSIVLQVEIGTLIRAALRRRSIPWWEIGPSALKKWTTGRGNAKKPEMAEHVCKRWGFESPSDDIVDAYALARFGEELQSNPPKLYKGVNYEG